MSRIVSKTGNNMNGFNAGSTPPNRAVVNFFQGSSFEGATGTGNTETDNIPNSFRITIDSKARFDSDINAGAGSYYEVGQADFRLFREFLGFGQSNVNYNRIKIDIRNNGQRISGIGSGDIQLGDLVSNSVNLEDYTATNFDSDIRLFLATQLPDSTYYRNVLVDNDSDRNPIYIDEITLEIPDSDFTTRALTYAMEFDSETGYDDLFLHGSAASQGGSTFAPAIVLQTPSARGFSFSDTTLDFSGLAADSEMLLFDVQVDGSNTVRFTDSDFVAAGVIASGGSKTYINTAIGDFFRDLRTLFNESPAGRRVRAARSTGLTNSDLTLEVFKRNPNNAARHTLVSSLNPFTSGGGGLVTLNDDDSDAVGLVYVNRGQGSGNFGFLPNFPVITFPEHASGNGPPNPFNVDSDGAGTLTNIRPIGSNNRIVPGALQNAFFVHIRPLGGGATIDRLFVAQNTSQSNGITKKIVGGPYASNELVRLADNTVSSFQTAFTTEMNLHGFNVFYQSQNTNIVNSNGDSANALQFTLTDQNTGFPVPVGININSAASQPVLVGRIGSAAVNSHGDRFNDAVLPYNNLFIGSLVNPGNTFPTDPLNRGILYGTIGHPVFDSDGDTTNNVTIAQTVDSDGLEFFDIERNIEIKFSQLESGSGAIEQLVPIADLNTGTLSANAATATTELASRIELAFDSDANVIRDAQMDSDYPRMHQDGSLLTIGGDAASGVWYLDSENGVPNTGVEIWPPLSDDAITITFETSDVVVGTSGGGAGMMMIADSEDAINVVDLGFPPARIVSLRVPAGNCFLEFHDSENSMEAHTTFRVRQGMWDFSEAGGIPVPADTARMVVKGPTGFNAYVELRR